MIDFLLRPSTAHQSECCVDERPDRAHEVAAAGQLDLDDLRAEVAEQRGRERRRDAGADVEDAKTRQGQWGRHGGKIRV